MPERMKKVHSSDHYEELPSGLAMSLGEDVEALNYFASLDKAQKLHLLNYIKGASTGGDARKRMDDVLEALHNHKSDVY